MNSGWRTTKIHAVVMDDIVKALPHLRKRNVQKYNSISEFVETACIELLDREGIKVEAVC